MKPRIFKNRFFVLFTIFVMSLYVYTYATASSLLVPTSSIRFAGPFQNTTLGIGGSVILDMTISTTAVSGSINFTNDPDVGALCGAGSFNGTRSGDSFQFTFTSHDSDPGCGIVENTVFSVSGTFSQGAITNGQFSHPSTGQGGTFSAKQTTRYSGTFSTNGYPGTVYIDLATSSSTVVTGYMNFTNDPGVGALCGAGSFRGSINGSNQMIYDFLSNDPDAGCGFDDGLEFSVTATLNQMVSISNGSYVVVDTGQTGTFSTACITGFENNNDQEENPNSNVSCIGDDLPPTGNITLPYSNPDLPPQNYPVYGPNSTIHIEASASDNLSGVERVEFWIGYDGQWHHVKDEYFSPYKADFAIPANLRTQIISIAIHVVDRVGNVAIDPGGKRYASYKESYGNPSVTENWIPASKRAYLNQRSLPAVVISGTSFSGDYQCGGASVAMALRMQNQISGTYSTLATTANNAFRASTYYSGGWITNYFSRLMSFMENNYAIDASWHYPNKSLGWQTIKDEIDNENPVIVLTDRNGTLGHYFVVVGYRETSTTKTLIVYDPYGKWRGSGASPNYDRNTTDQTSSKGKWVYYNYDQIWGYGGSTTVGRLMKIHLTGLVQQSSELFLGVPDTPPDEISIEPENLGQYNGVDVGVEPTIYMPLIMQP